MKRRDFIKKAALTTVGTIGIPYILPGGRLFAQTGSSSGQHVVLVMFAGGVRHQESIGMRYLDDAQVGEPYPGNIMYNLLNGTAPTQKIVYGTGQGGISPIPQILGQTLQQQGTIFSEVKAHYAGHYAGLNSILQGSSINGQGLRSRPVNPTIFEYLRRYGGYKATDVWFVGNGIDGSVPLLNYSNHPDYGIQYGANFFAPIVTFNQISQNYLGNGKVYHPENELAPMYKMKVFLDNNFSQNGATLHALGNTEEEKQSIKMFMGQMYEKTNMGTVALPPLADNGDSYAVGYACEVLKWFKPKFLTVNLSDVDQCHSNFTGYLSSLHRADHSVGHLWNYIQTQVPEMAGNTTIIAIPECGRNDEANAILDQNNWLSYDHSDANSMRIWSIMAGPTVPSNLVIGSENNPIGRVSDAMLTVADLLGVKSNVISAGFLAHDTQSFFDLL
ncbi:MAG: hypothetical protein IT223_01720 [Crocinitomicaceae bacterium]|nr:hypothetical protein [Crocinitomicaceae bacterium]